MDNEKNPLYEQRPRGMTAIYNKLSLLDTKWMIYAGLYAFSTIITMGLIIAGNEMTKEMRVSDQGIIIQEDPVATHQSVSVFDIDNMLTDNNIVDHLNDMRYVTIDTPDWVSKHTIESWVASDAYNYFSINTTDGHSLDFNGTHLDWDGNTISEVTEEPSRSLQGFSFKKFVKKKLDSPMCNTEALIDKVRGLKLIMAPACHVGVSGAKIYMHYNQK